MSQKFLRGYLVIGQAEFEFIVKFDEELFNYLKSGKKIGVKNVSEFEFLIGDDKNGL